MRLCVYTSIFGEYDRLVDQQVAGQSEADFVCFTDDPTLTSATWSVRFVTPELFADTVRSARLIKILGHPSLEEYDATLYIDASVRLLATPEHIVRMWLPDGVDMALAAHSYREHLVDEFDEVVRLMYDDQARVYEQLTDYAVAHPQVLDAQPLWTGIIVRRVVDRIRPAMRMWADHVLRYSRRDQLSVLVALEAAALSLNIVDLDNFASDLHEWPHIEGRRTALGKAPLVRSGPLLADLQRARTENEMLRAELDRRESDQVQELARSLNELRDAANDREEQNIELGHRVDEAGERARAAEVRVAELEAALQHLRALRPAAGNLRRAIVRRFRRR